MKLQSFRQKKETLTRGKEQSKEWRKPLSNIPIRHKTNIKDVLRAVKLKQHPPNHPLN